MATSRNNMRKAIKIDLHFHSIQHIKSQGEEYGGRQQSGFGLQQQ